MTGQLRTIGALLEERLKITQEIAAANVEHLRLSQKASGLMVLDMKDENDGQITPGRDLERQENFAALEDCMEKINDLEAALKEVDERLQAADDETKE